MLSINSAQRQCLQKYNLLDQVENYQHLLMIGQISQQEFNQKINDLFQGTISSLQSQSKGEAKFQVLTDILGDEDHHGDMDFKVTGTKKGITALQLDNKVAGLTVPILQKALFQAKEGRMHILGIMRETIDRPRGEISQYAPKVMSLIVPMEKIRDVIGSGGAIINGLELTYGVKVDLENETGKTFIYGKESEKVQACYKQILQIIKDYQRGDIVSGKIFRIEAYGAFVKILNEDGSETGKEGMMHISNLANRRVEKVEDVVKMGQIVTAVILEINEKGQIALRLKSE